LDRKAQQQTVVMLNREKGRKKKESAVRWGEVSIAARKEKGGSPAPTKFGKKGGRKSSAR